MSFFESVHASCEWEAGNGIFLRAHISWLQTCPWTLPALWLVEGGELRANERPPGILAWQWSSAGRLENSRERQSRRDRQVGTSRNNHLFCCVSPICQFSASWVFNYSSRQECEGGHWLVSCCALIFIRPLSFLPMFVWLAWELWTTVKQSRDHGEKYHVSDL